MRFCGKWTTTQVAFNWIHYACKNGWQSYVDKKSSEKQGWIAEEKTRARLVRSNKNFFEFFWQQVKGSNIFLKSVI